MLHIIEGDILLSDAAAICHQVNCQNVMGSGVAKELYIKWPEVKQRYHEFCKGKNPYDLLGKVQVVELDEFPAGNKVVINIFGQLNFGRQKVCYTDYSALDEAFQNLNRLCATKKIALPYGFGCGLAGGNWKTVERIMLKRLWLPEVYIYMKE